MSLVVECVCRVLVLRVFVRVCVSVFFVGVCVCVYDLNSLEGIQYRFTCMPSPQLPKYRVTQHILGLTPDMLKAHGAPLNICYVIHRDR